MGWWRGRGPHCPIGAALTLAPVVYVALERLIFVKVAAVGVLALLAVVFAIRRESWIALPSGLVGAEGFPGELGMALLLGAIAFAGAGGGQNLCQSNWIRDKGFGMGVYVPRLVSPVTGVEESREASAARYAFEPNPSNLAHWTRWWRFANLEQAVTFVIVTIVTICFTSMLAHSTLFGVPGLPNRIAFLQIEGERLQDAVGPWFGLLFWAVGAFSLFGASMGIADYTSRLAADVLKSTYLRESAWSESQLYFGLVWGLVGIGSGILWLGVSQPLLLLVISACVGGTMMCLYSWLLIVLNRRELPEPIRLRGYRRAALVLATIFFGTLAALTVWEQAGRLAH